MDERNLTTDNPKGIIGICRRCKKFVDRHYGDDLYCYGDSHSKEKFVSYKWQTKIKGEDNEN